MSRYLTIGLLLVVAAAPAGAQSRYGYYGGRRDYAAKFRVTLALGYDSSGVVNTLTFKDRTNLDGWNWELNATYQGGKPFLFEAGFLGWTLSGGSQATGTYVDAKKAGVAATVGARFGATEAGFGVVPNGSRLLLRRILSGRTDGKGVILQVSLFFPTVARTDNFVAFNVGYSF